MRAFPLALSLLVLAGCGGGDVEVGPGGVLLEGGVRAESTDVRGVALAGRALVLDGFAGAVTVVGAPDAQGRATLRFTRVARADRARSARERLASITIEEAGDGQTYRYVMRTTRPNGAEVDVEARVPPGTRLIVQQDAGRVRISGVRGDVEVRLASGAIEAAGLAGRRVVLRTDAGNVDAAAAAVPLDADWRIETDAGALALTLPPDSPTRVEARTDVGAVRVDGLVFTDEWLDREAVGMRFHGQLAPGRGRIRLSTSVGAIRLRGGRVTQLEGMETPAPPAAAPAPPPAAPPAPPRAPAEPRPAPAR